MDNFAVALLGFYWVDQLVAETSDASERHKQIRETFLRYEQLTGYVRYFGGATDIMGITRVKARILDESFKISLGLSSEQQILSDQASYGLWGLYSSAARDTGLVEGNDRKITVDGQSIAQLILAQLGDAADTLLNDKPQTARVLPIGVHPFIVGTTHRFPYFVKMLEHLKNTPGVIFMTATEIYEWYVGETSGG